MSNPTRVPDHTRCRKALLLLPEFPADSFWSYRYVLRLIGRKAAFPPLGLLTVAALLPDDWQVELIDLNVQRLPDAVLRRKLAAADVAFISAMSIQKRALVRILEGPARALPTPVVLGGPLASSYRAEILHPATASDRTLHRGLDVLVWGEAEPVMPRLLERLRTLSHDDARSPELLIPEVVAAAAPGSRRYLNDRGIFTPLAPARAPRWDLVRVKDYHSLMLQTSAGCPFRCDFCDIIQFNGGFTRPKPPHIVRRELEAIFAAHYRGSVFTVDDNFVGAPAAMGEILDAMIEFQRAHRYPFSFYTQASVNLGTRELAPLLEKMRQAGFEAVFLGIENPDPAALRLMNKQQNVKVDIAAAVRRIQAAGIEVYGGFILGGDADDRGTADHIVEFVRRNRIFTAMAGILTPVPFTPLYERLRAQGRLRPAEFSGNNTDDEVQFDPYALTAGELRGAIHHVLERLFVPGEAYRRALDMVQAVRLHIFSRSRLHVRYLRAALLSLWIQGVRRFDPAYFRLLWRAGWLDHRRLRRWRAQRRLLRAVVRSAYRGGEIAAKERVRLDTMLRFAHEYAVRFRADARVPELDRRIADARARLAEGTLLPGELRAFYRDARRYVRVRLRRHHFPGAELARALEAAVKSLHYESVMEAIVARGAGARFSRGG